MELVLPGGDEQLASQPSPQNGAIDEVVVKRDADVSEVVLDVAPRQALRGGKQTNSLNSEQWLEIARFS